MFTKEESQKHLDDLKVVICKVSHCKELFPERNCEECRSYLNFKGIEQLIEEHFDNPPLKFEELKKGMWVWDSKEKWWRNIVIVFAPCNEYPKGSFKAWGDSAETQLDFIEYKENRFYRKKVD